MKRKSKDVLIEIVVAVLAVIVLFPFFLVVINSAKKSADIVVSPIRLPSNWMQFFNNVNNVINHQNFSYWSSFYSSLLITAVSLVLICLFAAMAAWVLCRNKTWWSSVIFMMLVASMIIPFQVVMLPLLSTFRDLGNFMGIKMLQSYGGIIFAYIGFGGALSVFILHGFIKGIPISLEEAARIDGCSKEGIFFKIIVPLLKPVLVTITILNGLWIWNDYLLPSLMLGLNGRIKTLPVAVTSFVGSYVKQWDLILAAAFLAMVPIIILFILAQKQIMQGMVDGAVK